MTSVWLWKTTQTDCVIVTFVGQWLSGQTRQETTSWKKIWMALMGKTAAMWEGPNNTPSIRCCRKQKRLCLCTTVWCVWEAMACSVKYYMVWSDGHSRRPACVRTTPLWRCSHVGFISGSSRQVTTAQAHVTLFEAVTHTLLTVPAGSTDCVCYATVGVIDPVTSALHVIIGEEGVSLDSVRRVSFRVDRLVVSHAALQETLSLWTCAQCIMLLLSCATRCLCWVMASTEMS